MTQAPNLCHASTEPSADSTESPRVLLHVPSLYHESTELSADSIESHPFLPFVFADSTYQVDQETAADGSMLCDVCDTLDGPAILDTKWCVEGRDADPLGTLGIADATGHVTLVDLVDRGSDTGLKFAQRAHWRMNGEGALCLSLDWSAGRWRGGATGGAGMGGGTPEGDGGAAQHLHASVPPSPGPPASLIVSQSNGTLATVPRLASDTDASGAPRGLETWHAHDYEAWTVAWDCWSDATVAWSGGDDLQLKGWDLRTPIHDGSREPTFTCQKPFGGGVTALESHPTREHYWAVGSYDEMLRLFDARHTRRPVSETPVGGGVWRAKWHPSCAPLLLLGCMHGGFKIVQCAGLQEGGTPTEAPMDIVSQFDEHKSIAYGCDWERARPADALVYSCSFYDAALHIWNWMQ
ncbi:methylated diphthine methylhydrolase [Malassezia sp. CBS 17886]|nr:methylated diphthine methylhydrolase [Malassezia sp. CBS 17886]